MTVVSDSELAKMIRAIAREEARAELALAGNQGVYRSRGGVLPPGCKNGRAMIDRIKRYSIAHSVEGTATQAVYICTLTDWANGMHRLGKVKAPALRLVPSSDEELAESFLAGAGVRMTGGAK